MFGFLRGKEKTSTKSSFRPMLEGLEERLMLDAYWWRGTLSSDFNTSGNWWNNTTGATATRVPGSNDDATFDGVSPPNCNLLSGTGDCRSLRATPAWGGALEISDAKLNVWGENLPAGGKSDWGSGTISAGSSTEPSSGPGSLNLLGGNFEYKSVSINNFYASPRALSVYVSNSANLKFIGNTFRTLGADLYIGRDHDGATSAGQVTFNVTGGTVKTKTDIFTSVLSTGTLDLSGQVNDTWITSAGNLLIQSGATLGVASGKTLSVTGGFFQFLGLGSFTINGNVDVSGGLMQMGTIPGQYSNATINGNLTLSNCVYSYDVNSGSANQCDKLTATNITINSGCTSRCYTAGTTTFGMHSYDVLAATNSFTGTFSTLAWDGSNPHPLNGSDWSTSYANNKFNLNGISS